MIDLKFCPVAFHRLFKSNAPFIYRKRTVCRFVITIGNDVCLVGNCLGFTHFMFKIIRAYSVVPDFHRVGDWEGQPASVFACDEEHWPETGRVAE